jgi:hypothetical protein
VEPNTPSAAKSGASLPDGSQEKVERNTSSSPSAGPGVGRSARASELSAPGIDDRFAVTRQVTALERSIELYQMFIERAGDDPRYEEAVRRSRARMEDAQVTVCFLLEKPCDGNSGR